MTNARIERARGQLDALRMATKAAEARAAIFGPKCSACRHSSYGGDPWECLHPAIQKVSVEWTGAVTLDGRKRAMDMRDDDGLCGPEAVLFEPRQFYRRVPVFALLGAAWCAPWIYVAVTSFGGFAVMCLFAILPIGAEFGAGRWAQ